jgi:hypothetical protein
VFFFRRLSRGLPHNIKYSSSKERFVRSAVLCLAILLVCLGFWQNSKNYVKKFSLEQRIDDVQSILGSAYKSSLAGILDRVETQYGVKIYIKISPLPVVSSDTLPGAILLGVCPKSKQFVLLMPESWKHSLGEGFIMRLREEIMRPSFEQEHVSGDVSGFKAEVWQTALHKVLESLEKRMSEL